MLGVEQWAELRREHFVRGVSIKELARRTGLSRNTVRAALRSPTPPRYRRAPAGSKLDPFKPEICRLLREEPGLPSQRIREEIALLGFTGGKTIVDGCVRELRPLFAVERTFQRTVYRPGELCQFDIWRPREEIPVGHGQTRPGYVVVACLGYSRAGAGTVVFSRQAEDVLFGLVRCLWRLGGLAQTLVWDRESCLHAGGGRPTDIYAALCGTLAVGWHFCAPRDPQGKGAVERLQEFMETSFEPGRRFANHLDFQDQLDSWFDGRANGRVHRTLRVRPADRLTDELAVMAPLPARPPDTDRRWVLRVAPDPYVRFDTCDYSLDPDLVGQRVEVRVTERELLAVALDSGAVAARHQRSFARHRTITDLAHARILKERRLARLERDQQPRRGERDVEVQVRSLDVYDRLGA